MYTFFLYLSCKTHLASPKIRKISRINTRFKHNICTSQRRHSEVLFFGKQRETFSTHQKLRHKTSAKKTNTEHHFPLPRPRISSHCNTTDVFLLKSNKHLLTILGFHHLDSLQAVHSPYLKYKTKSENNLTHSQTNN